MNTPNDHTPATESADIEFEVQGRYVNAQGDASAWGVHAVSPTEDEAWANYARRLLVTRPGDEFRVVEVARRVVPPATTIEEGE